MSSKKHPSDNILWKDIESLVSEEQHRDFLSTIDPKTYLLLLDENSRSQVEESILKMLKEKDPENATKEFAEEIVELMQKIAKRYVSAKTYKSFLMGASQITDEELASLDIEIIKNEESDVRKLVIPSKSIEEYKEIIRQKLDEGFWNDFVGEDQIYFIFKMPDGEIKEYEYSEEDRLEIANLCTQLNKDPIEKTSDLLNYLSENEFYTETIQGFKKIDCHDS